MKSIRKIVFALLLSILCIGCNNNNKIIKITINSGVGSFTDKSTITTLLVNPGTKLSECRFTAPSINIYRIDDSRSEQEVPVLNYLMEDNKVYEDTPITSDITLYANYYESLDEEKEISRNTITDTYEMIQNKTEILTAQYRKAINKINQSTTSYELFLLVNDYEKFLRAIPHIDEETELPTLININDMILSHAEKVKDDQRIMSYITPLNGLFTMSVNKNQEYLLCVKQIFYVINKYVERINPNISYIYGEPFDAFIRAYAQNSKLMVLLTSFYTYAEACTHCDTISKASGLGRPLIGLASMGVMRDDLVPILIDIYEEFVEYTLNS